MGVVLLPSSMLPLMADAEHFIEQSLREFEQGGSRVADQSNHIVSLLDKPERYR